MASHQSIRQKRISLLVGLHASFYCMHDFFFYLRTSKTVKVTAKWRFLNFKRLDEIHNRKKKINVSACVYVCPCYPCLQVVIYVHQVIMVQFLKKKLKYLKEMLARKKSKDTSSGQDIRIESKSIGLLAQFKVFLRKNFLEAV